jgi:hypothetical protein
MTNEALAIYFAEGLVLCQFWISDLKDTVSLAFGEQIRQRMITVDPTFFGIVIMFDP